MSSPLQLGSRNPFLGLLTPQPTGASTSNDTNQNTSNAPATSSAAAASNATHDTNDERTDKPSPPRIQRQITGVLNSSAPQPTTTTTYTPPPGAPPPALPPRTTVTSPENETHLARSATLDLLEEDLPPEYTPGPNASQGEQSVDFGPVRPFQNVSTSRPAPQPVYASTRSAPAMPGGYPGLSAVDDNGYSRSRGFQDPLDRIRSRRGGSGGGIIGLLGELAIAYMDSRESPARTPSGRSVPSQPAAPYGRSVPPAPSQPSQPAVLSRRSVSSAGGGGRSWNAYPGQMPPRSVTPEARAQPASDGKPTARPIPGHPLLKDNKILVYPLGYECRKCFNKGFRPRHASTFDATPRALAPGDPSDPCKHCWKKYSKPYTAAMAQLDWNDVHAESNFQRPISDPLNPPSPSAGRQQQSTSSRTFGERQRASEEVVVNSASGHPAAIQQQYTGAPTTVQWMTDSPSGRVMYEPGDSRIGGRLCMRCHGSGRVRIFILDTEICPLCKGIGRTFY